MFGTSPTVRSPRAGRSGPGRACELEHLPSEAVDPLDRVAGLRREDLSLDLLDVFAQCLDDRLVRVDDPVDDGV